MTFFPRNTLLIVSGKKGKTMTYPLLHTSTAKECTTGLGKKTIKGSESVSMTQGMPCTCGGTKFTPKCYIFQDKIWTALEGSMLIGRKTAFALQINDDDFMVMGNISLHLVPRKSKFFSILWKFVIFIEIKSF